jgi:uncharacterized membrane protein
MTEHIARTPKDMVDVAELFKRTWALFQVKPVEHVVASLIVLVLSVLSLGVLLGPLSVGQIRMIEKQQRGEEPRIDDVFSGFSSFGPALLTTLVFFIAMTIGALLFVVPGVFVGVAWGFALWFVALEGASATEALASSWQLFKGHMASVLVVLVIMGVVNVIAGSVVLATLLSAPLSMIFCTLAFQDMQNVAPASGQGSP